MANSFETWGKKYGLILSILVGIALWLIPTPATMTIAQHKLLSLFGAAVVAWITIGVNFAVSTFFVVVLLYFWVGNPDGAFDKTGKLIRNAEFAVSGFASSSLWLLVTGFVISIAMTKSGVAKRLAAELQQEPYLPLCWLILLSLRLHRQIRPELRQCCLLWRGLLKLTKLCRAKAILDVRWH